MFSRTTPCNVMGLEKYRLTKTSNYVNLDIWNCPQREEISYLKYLIKEVLSSLPSNKDWLNPDIEKAMKDAIKE